MGGSGCDYTTGYSAYPTQKQIFFTIQKQSKHFSTQLTTIPNFTEDPYNYSITTILLQLSLQLYVYFGKDSYAHQNHWQALRLLAICQELEKKDFQDF